MLQDRATTKGDQRPWFFSSWAERRMRRALVWSRSRELPAAAIWAAPPSCGFWGGNVSGDPGMEMGRRSFHGCGHGRGRRGRGKEGMIERRSWLCLVRRMGDGAFSHLHSFGRLAHLLEFCISGSDRFCRVLI